MPRPILEIDHLTHAYFNGTGIHDICARIFPGEFILLAGPNGSGKTTLIKHLNALVRPTSGEIRLHGRSVTENLIVTRKTIGMVFQDADTQIVADTVEDEVAFGLENLNTPRARILEKVDQTLAYMNLNHLQDRNPSTLSGGEKRRLAIAGILVMDPEIVVLDEPFANLDHPGSRDLVEIICRLNREGQTIIMATHEVEEVIPHASRMLIMDGQGRLVKDGPPNELLGDLEPFGIREPCFSRMGYTTPPWQT